jgi:hypothetical protein
LVVPRSMPITFAIALSSSFAEPPSPEAARPKEGPIRRSPRPPQATGPRQTVYEFPRRSAGCGVYKGAPTGLQGAPTPLIFRGKASGFRAPLGPLALVSAAIGRPMAGAAGRTVLVPQLLAAALNSGAAVLLPERSRATRPGHRGNATYGSPIPYRPRRSASRT